MALAALRYMVRTGKKVGQDVVGKFDEESMDPGEAIVIFANAAPSHYGTAQGFVMDIIRDFAHLPVDRVVWSAHEAKGKDAYTGATIYGPGLVGQAATKDLPVMMGDMLHLDRYDEEVSDPNNPADRYRQSGVRAWMKPHIDPEMPSILWPATLRVSALQIVGVPDEAETLTNMQKVWGKWPRKFIELGDGDGEGHVVDYLRFKDEELLNQAEKVRRWKAMVDARRAGVDRGQPTGNVPTHRLVAMPASAPASISELASLPEPTMIPVLAGYGVIPKKDEVDSAGLGDGTIADVLAQAMVGGNVPVWRENLGINEVPPQVPPMAGSEGDPVPPRRAPRVRRVETT
jgi:hypothetical protein